MTKKINDNQLSTALRQNAKRRKNKSIQPKLGSDGLKQEEKLKKEK